MKYLIIFASFLFFLAFASCESTEEGTTSTDNPDTSVLVEDPGNTLNADPINDTMVADTAHVE